MVYEFGIGLQSYHKNISSKLNLLNQYQYPEQLFPVLNPLYSGIVGQYALVLIHF